MMTGDPIPYTDTVIEGPVVEPLDLDQVKKFLRFGATSEDTLLDAWISAARQLFEQQTGRHPIAVLRERWLDAFPPVIELPAPPLLEVVSVTYVGGDGELSTIDPGSYVVKAPQGPTASCGWIQPAFGTLWPTPQAVPGAVRVRYYAGYGRVPGEVPELVRSLLFLLVAHFHKYRTPVQEGTHTEIPIGIKMMLEHYKFTALPTQQPRVGVPTWV